MGLKDNLFGFAAVIGIGALTPLICNSLQSESCEELVEQNLRKSSFIPNQDSIEGFE
ncbi:hypothetical protein J4467_03935 [Candidatus Woesearchaeota archaeon]|nr:hypothetical protein [Candidatus Woesearchaeota archaeon]